MNRKSITNKLKLHFSTFLAGFLASLVMHICIYLGIETIGIAPFNSPPAAAFLYNLGVESDGYALLLHFCYGIFWAYVLVFAFEDDISIKKALGLSFILWVFMMIVYSPLIGWGIFGFGYAHYLSSDHPLFLTYGFLYLTITLIVHFVYGYVVGYVTKLFIDRKNSMHKKPVLQSEQVPVHKDLI